MAQLAKPTGFIFYRGPSALTGLPIIGVAIIKASKNGKTGAMVQTYILVDNGESPVTNARELDDESICGDCKHRRGLGGACYVNLGQGARAVADGIVRGIYPQNAAAAARACTGRKVRLGAYGDPAAIPARAWRQLLAGSIGHSGYSHQWRNPAFKSIMQWCMASCDDEQDYRDAHEAGFRTFRVRTVDQPLIKGEFVCPASEEAGKVKLCETCLACDGGIGSRKASAAIIVHGSLKSRFIPIYAN
jgi:hypothetical protein